MRKRRNEERKRKDKSRRGARIPEQTQPGGPSTIVEPPGGFAVPVTEKEKQHDGWSEIRPRDPRETTLF